MTKPMVIQGRARGAADQGRLTRAEHAEAVDVFREAVGIDRAQDPHNTKFANRIDALDYFDWLLEFLRAHDAQGEVTFHDCPHADGEVGDFNCADPQWNLRREVI